MATRRGFLGGLLSLPFLKAGKAKLSVRRGDAVWDPVGIGGPIVDDGTQLATLQGIPRSRGPHVHYHPTPQNIAINDWDRGGLPSTRQPIAYQCLDPNCTRRP